MYSDAMRGGTGLILGDAKVYRFHMKSESVLSLLSGALNQERIVVMQFERKMGKARQHAAQQPGLMQGLFLFLVELV